ncbi:MULTISPECIES: class I SAM-dependent methyltransferase [Paenibacillus]|uniref:class I SAM-dependent methyltransferase n=1 Tax=Paenibacillus TaxID=44249 RepID=UPI0022B87F47|nr:class I SAM-dependent methyltransferase [Paenibacillus caseinilyticus]MCZ8522567.1 class I SAM-dependent methyltransferase [Paenibacillus caseinilyticus]
MDYLDMLTRLGVSSAHPGGFSATLSQLQRFPLPAGSRVLEVGCGTGRTACHLAALGMNVTGLDIRPEMLAKAGHRAAHQGVDVHFVAGSITELPFEEGSFDVILAESVTNFASIPEALREYNRVLSPGGLLYDRELILSAALPREAYEQLAGFFGFGGLLGEDGWREELRLAGFGAVQVWDRLPFGRPPGEDLTEHPDPHQLMDHGAILDAAVWQTSIAHDELIETHQAYLAHALFAARK